LGWDDKVISEKHILRVNSPGYGTSKTLEHTSAEILSEYRVIIINPVSPRHILPSLDRLDSISREGVLRVIDSGKYVIRCSSDLSHFKREFEVRNSQLIKFFQAGGLLISFLQPLFVLAGDRPFITLSNYDGLFYYGLYDVCTLRERCRGEEVIPTDRGLESSFAPYLKLQGLEWNACVQEFKTQNLRVLAVNRDKDAVSFIINFGKGKAVFLPVCSNFTQGIDKLLIECVDKEYTSMTFEEEPADTWVEKYYIPGMPELEKEISDIRGEIDKLKQVETTKGKELKELKSYRDILLNKKGHALQNTVIEILNKMGIQAQPGPEGRDDIVIKEGDKVVAVCEVKGDKKSAGEADATQLSKWVDRVYEEEGYEPKGILIVNAFCEKDIPERTEKPFPDQMLPYCSNRGYCLLTTVKLFNVFCECKREKISDGKIILKEWIECKGIYDKYQDIRPNLISEEKDSV